MKEALDRPDKELWRKAIEEEMESLKANGTWTLVKRPLDRNVIGSKFVFKVKTKSDGTVERYKARLVAKGYSQQEGIDYNETFAPVMKIQSLRVLLALANQRQAHLHQMDVTTAFLYGDLEEDLYMAQPEGQAKPGEEAMVCKLRKSIYGLKQSPRMWNKRLDEFMRREGLIRIQEDHAIYVLTSNPSQLFVGVYVDDLIIGSSELGVIHSLKESLSQEFRMKDLGDLSYVLGIKIMRTNDCLYLSQKQYAMELLRKFKMEECNGAMTPMDPSPDLENFETSMCGDNVPYREAVGSLMYLMTCTRPDLATSVSFVSKYLSEPRVNHWLAVKRIFRYVAKTINFGIMFRREQDRPIITGFSDADWAGDVASRKSRSGYIFVMGGGAVSWKSKLQDIVTLSTAESEYVAATEAGKEAIWLSGLLTDLGVPAANPTLMMDNQSAIRLASNPVYHQRTKHIDVRFHKIREWVGSNQFSLAYIPTKEMAANFLTKNVNLDYNRRLVGVEIPEV